MIEKRRVDPMVLLLVLAALLFSAAGCQKPMKRQILGFFFTGIEPVEEKERPEEKKPPEPAKQATPAAGGRMLPPEPISFTHGPYAAGLCRECHETGRVERQDRRNRLPRSMAGLPGMLTTPPEVLCTMCHESMSASHAQSAGLWLHGPAVQGNCTVCHHPHQSPNPRMLIETSEKICIQCHEEIFSRKAGEHAGTRGCLTCHNPHLGKTRLLLKAEYREESFLAGSRAESGALREKQGRPEKNGARSGASD
jgi:predicted CXXCH cytochrome family protein